ncbi:MAG: alpha/beta hydrolase [Flavobacteriaceae bacterium]|jgi:predicted alpha/beta hydrolase family esterase|nr:alpha/beta hydrolase [Flavobacteriaceae bacterium]
MKTEKLYFFTIPGHSNSSEEHWQSIIEREQKLPIQRINQQDWYTPNCNQWISAIDEHLSGYELSKVVLIGHSLGCTAIIHWLHNYKKKIKAAILVAPPDVDSQKFQKEIESVAFTPMPLEKLNCYSVVIASEDDEWITLEKAKFYSEKWDSLFITIGKAGHVNATSGYGKWDKIYEIIENIPD